MLKEFPGIDKLYINFSGKLYDDTSFVSNIVSLNTVQYPISSIANFADTTEIYYKDSLILRKAKGEESYSIGFERRQFHLNEKYGNNEREIAIVKQKLESLLNNEEYNLDSIIISATASPEGSIKINTEYSNKRSLAVTRYFNNFVNPL